MMQAQGVLHIIKHGFHPIKNSEIKKNTLLQFTKINFSLPPTRIRLIPLTRNNRLTYKYYNKYG